MANKKQDTIKKTERQLKKMIQDRTGKPAESWLDPQIHLTASVKEIVDKIHDEIMDSGDLVNAVAGSMAQIKNEVNPLLPYYDKMSRNLQQQYEALGLNYNVQPKKVTENTKAGASEQDAFSALLTDVKDNV